MRDKTYRSQREWTPPSGFGPFVVVVAWVVTVIALAALAFTEVASPAPAAKAAASVHCGQVVKRSITLHRDVTGCRFGGLVAGRSGITINLNGHTVGGLGAGVGIRVQGARRVKVRNGTVRGFEVGVLLHQAHRSRLANVRVVRSSDAGMHVLHTLRSRFRGVRISGNADAGIHVVGSHGNLFRRLVLNGNSDAGISLLHSNFNRLRGLRMVGNGDAGVRVAYSHRNHIRNITAVGSSDAGISLQRSSRNVVVGNVVNRNGEGISLDGGTRNVVVRNAAAANGGAGIEVGAETTLTRVGGNFSHHNLGDGIYVEAAGTRLHRNRANCNGGMGIKAVNQSIRALANWAAGNNDKTGCLGIRCLRAAAFAGCGGPGH